MSVDKRGWGSLDKTPHGIHIFIPYNVELASLNHADVAKHTLVLSNVLGTGAIIGETRKIVAVILSLNPVAVTGAVLFYSNEGTWYTSANSFDHCIFVTVKDGTNRLQYAQDTAGDEWILYCFGYVVET